VNGRRMRGATDQLDRQLVVRPICGLCRKPVVFWHTATAPNRAGALWEEPYRVLRPGGRCWLHEDTRRMECAR
jgi:hypothetical protein